MKKYFLTGLITLLPLTLTLWIVVTVIDFLTKPFMGAVKKLLISYPSLSHYIPNPLFKGFSEFVILIALVFFTFFLGLVARKIFFNQILRLGDRLLHKIPFVNKVYKTSKDIISSFFNNSQQSFKQVVMLPFPKKGSYCLALIISESPATCSQVQGEDLITVFIPTTPNPTSGYLILTKKSDLIFLKMSSEDAIKYVVSCAVIQPTKKEAVS
jgi:uncharacterized membrane protein